MDIDKDDPKLQAALQKGTEPVHLCHCGAKRVRATTVMRTDLGIVFNEGHYHDTSVETRTVICERGHETVQQLIHRCPHPDCKWQGPEPSGLQDIGWERVVAWPQLP